MTISPSDVCRVAVGFMALDYGTFGDRFASYGVEFLGLGSLPKSPRILGGVSFFHANYAQPGA